MEVTLSPDGKPSYSVSRGGKPVIAPSRLGFLFTDATKIDRFLSLAGQRTRSFDETWEQPWGERRFVRNRYNELRVRLTERLARQAQRRCRVPRL